jgi:hypothetical protein
MRAGTQTLIQALQALPWTAETDNEDDVLYHALTPIDTESETSNSETSEDEKGPGQREFDIRAAIKN